MNRATIIGNLTRDPQANTVNTQNGAHDVCQFGVAVNNGRRNGQEVPPTFFNVTAWDQNARNCNMYLRKGSKVCVIGPVSARTYQANNGEMRVSLEVQCREVEFLSSKPDANAAPQQQNASTAPQGYGNPYEQPNDPSGFTPVDTDDLPF